MVYTLSSSPAHLPRACQRWCTHSPPPQLTYPGLDRVGVHTLLLPSSLTPGLPEMVYTLSSSPANLPRACQSWCTHSPPPQLTYPGLARVGVHTVLHPSSLTPGLPELAYALSSSPAHLPRSCQSWRAHSPPPQLTYPGLARVGVHTLLLPSSLTPGLTELVYTLSSSPAHLPRAWQSWCTHSPPPQLTYPGLDRVGVHTVLLPSSLTPGLTELACTLSSSPANLPRACQSWCTHSPPPQLTYPGLDRVGVHTLLLPSSLTPGLTELVYTLSSSPAHLPRAWQSWCTHSPPPQLTYPGLDRVGVHTLLLPSSLTPGLTELVYTLSSSPAHLPRACQSWCTHCPPPQHGR